jgi:hypothetical protein
MHLGTLEPSPPLRGRGQGEGGVGGPSADVAQTPPPPAPPRKGEGGAARDPWLSARGYRILQIAKAAVAQNIDAVMQRIITACTAGTPTPGLSPQRGGDA